MYLKKFLMTMAAALCMLPLSAINPQNSKMKELNVLNSNRQCNSVEFIVS